MIEISFLPGETAIFVAGPAGDKGRPIKGRTSPMKFRHAGSRSSPRQCESAAVCTSSNMIGRSQGSIITGIKVFFRSAKAASARTHRDVTDCLYQNTTKTL